MPVIIELKEENEFRLTAQELRDAITDKTKILILPFPNNPTGAIMEKKDLEEIAEIIREKLLLNLQQEIPHGTAVLIERMREREDQNIIDIEATIYCEKASHKGMIIGKGGQCLKRIATAARADLETFLDTHVNLKCWVKVQEGWRNQDSAIRNFGLSDDQ